MGTDRFGHYEIAQGADAQPITLPRSPDELVLLAFDTRIRRMVEIHILKSGEPLRAAEKASAFERLRMAADLGHATFTRILEYGEDSDAVYYSSTLNDGEPLDRFLTRRGALPPATTFSLLIQLLDDVIRLQEMPRLIEQVRLEHLFITLQEETFLQLRVLDFGFSKSEQDLPPEEVEHRLVEEACGAAFLMLTGRAYAGDDCDRVTVLTGLPSGLRTLLRGTLAGTSKVPCTLQRLRDQLRDALMAQTRDLQGRASRRNLVAADTMLPQSALREILLHDVRMEQLLKGRLVAESAHAQQRYPFTFQGVDARTEAPVNVHLLPPRRIVSNEHYDAVPLQMWRFQPDTHPNILRSLSVWESPDLTFLTEEHSPGFPLSRLIAERVYLNPAEVLIILRQVKAGLEQALECGVEKLDLHPCNIFLKLAGTPHAREMEKLLQKRLDAWPRFIVMLRPHATMRSLYEPLLVEVEPPEANDGFFDAVDFRHRSYVALAAYLLSGQFQGLGQRKLPESLPEPLAKYLEDCTARARQPGQSPSPQEFLHEFELRTAVPEEPERGGLVLPARREATRTMVSESVAPEEPMESAGSVSDFDEDQVVSDDTWDEGQGSPSFPVDAPSALGNRFPLSLKGRPGMLLWAAAVLLVLLVIAFAVFSGGEDEGARDDVTNEKVSPGPALPTGEAAPPINPQTGKPMTQEEIRRALLPSEREKDFLRKSQQKPGASIAGKPAPGHTVHHRDEVQERGDA